MKTLVVITYYKRKDSVIKLVEQLLHERAVDVVLFDDCSEDGIAKCFISKRVKVISAAAHRGKEGFWQTYNDIFAYCRQHIYDYYIILPDDVYPCPGFVKKATDTFDSIDGCISLSPLLTNNSLLRGLSRWGMKPVTTRDNHYISNFFDCCGVVKRDFFEALEWHLYPIEPSANKLRSSVVGRQITTRLQQKGCKMCHVKRTLLSTTSDVSRMNPEERAIHPMRADFTDNEACVDMYMAALWRGGHVVVTANSLLSQPELKSLTICCNFFTDDQFEYVRKALSDKRVILHRTNNEKGSNEKLRFIHTGTAKYIALADDDLIYPDGYLFKMIHGCNIHNGAVSLHGGVLTRFPIIHYYGGRKKYSWNMTVTEDTPVDILGNGFVLFRREWFSKDELKEIYDSAPAVSMDDIILSLRFKQKQIPTYVLRHGSRYARHKQLNSSDMYVYDAYKNNDTTQVEYINTMYNRSMLVLR